MANFSIDLNEEDIRNIIQFNDLYIYITQPESNIIRMNGMSYYIDDKTNTILENVKNKILRQYTINRDELWYNNNIIVFHDNERLYQYRMVIVEEVSGFLMFLRTIQLEISLENVELYLNHKKEKELIDKLINENNNPSLKVKL